MDIIEYYNFEVSEAFVFDEFIINQFKEGVIVEPKYNDLLNDCIKKHFSGKKMVYISNRAKSYSVNPLIYKEAEKIPNLIAIAIIPKTDIMRKNAEYELKFYDKPYEIFDNLTNAIEWAHSLIAKTES
ncbi:hypothetical protein LX77_01830 [Gelidibacter algens]|jgi:hypothetical protein|uniref:SpoIIAA-like protein n=1 Tax=Gelidibacter algens TaxID=49280 RepID=A0A1A7R486_9FLAO|nr:hypothetical protein [Gelidibacter algens]OBX26284.1 hypothetical protein A9996_05785 [Gelidibacter algens]RAJ24831.1 hypothetical protein LX77_01830 [Gelidibacter algens]